MTLAMSRCETAAGTRCRASCVAANEAGAIAKVTSGHLAVGSGSVIGLERYTRHRPSPGSSPALIRQTDEIARIVFGQALSAHSMSMSTNRKSISRLTLGLNLASVGLQWTMREYRHPSNHQPLHRQFSVAERVNSLLNC